MKNYTLSYLLFVFGTIFVLLSASAVIVMGNGATGPKPASIAAFFLSDFATGMAICLFVHLIAKFIGLSLYWRVGLNALVPISLSLLSLLHAGMFFTELRGLLVFALIFDTLRFLFCSVAAECWMLDSTERFSWLRLPEVADGG